MQHYLSFPQGEMPMQEGVAQYSPRLHGQPEFLLGRAHAGTSAQGARTVRLRRGRLEDGYRTRRGEQNQRVTCVMLGDAFEFSDARAI